MATTYAIPDGRVAMAATLYTGTGAAQTISNAVNGVSFQPDWVWLKGRSFVSYNGLIDSVRGRSSDLYSNATSAEESSGSTQDLTAFTASGFSLGTSARFDSNNSGQTYVAWQWKAGGTAVSNTAGSITSSVSANTDAGFSVVTYTSTTGTVGHGLGVAPSMIIMKGRNVVDQWTVYHISTGNTIGIPLNTTGAGDVNSAFWSNTTPTSTVFSQGSWDSGYTKVAYCFAPVAGYSAFGSYTGNGSADGPFVYTAMLPRFVMIKRTDSTGEWILVDSSRNPYNVVNSILAANETTTETGFGTSNRTLDFLSNGFKIRTTAAGGTTAMNASGGTYIYMAFAENPFKFSNAR